MILHLGVGAHLAVPLLHRVDHIMLTLVHTACRRAVVGRRVKLGMSAAAMHIRVTSQVSTHPHIIVPLLTAHIVVATVLVLHADHPAMA